MDERFRNIRVLIWDFDGTLYKPNPALLRAVREAEYKTIGKHTGWSRKKVIEEFEKLHLKVYLSATEVVAKLSGVSVSAAALETEEYFDRRKYLSRDERLISMFAKLKMFRNFTLANGVIAKHKEALAVLGLPPDTFEEMVTAETVGVTKPHEKGFLYIMRKTEVPATEHLMIGDRELVDLAPAKKLGMKTCLVWTKQKQNKYADISLSTVYDIEKILL